VSGLVDNRRIKMGCGCSNNTPNTNPVGQQQCKPRCNSCPGSIQPEMVRMSRNVNANCESSCSKTAKTCTRREWLAGIDCSGMGFNLDNAELGVEQGAIARLRAVYKNSAGSYVDPVEPRITIRGPCGKIFLSNQGLSRQDIGKYFFLFGTDGNTDFGLWSAEVTGVVLENGNNIRVTGQYYFAVLPIGSIPFNNCNDGYGPDGYGDGYGCDGYGDGYGHCGHGIQSGADGYGTFAGRESCGFDGCRSKDIPATGGCRTNRNEIGDGFWDGISNKESCITPIGKRGMCVIGETLVDSMKGQIQIKDVRIGDILKVWNKNDGKFSFQKVTKCHTNNTKDGHLCEVTTERGRQIICTKEHPFVLSNNTEYTKGKDLKPGDRLLVEPLATKYDFVEYSVENIITEELIYSRLKTIYNEDQIKAAIKDLKEKGFCPLSNQDERSLILARVTGYLFGDGGISKYLNPNGKKRLGSAFFCGSIEEIEEVQKDVRSLGFAVGPIRTRQADSEIAHGMSSQSNCREAAFCELMYILGSPIGSKSIQSTEIPQWIYENKNYLREFLGSLYGSEGFDCTTSKRTLNYLCFTFNKDHNLEISARYYAQQLIDGFKKFGIDMVLKIQPGVIRKDGKVTTQYRIMRTGNIKERISSRKALLQFVSQIGIRYSPKKEQSFRKMSEYQRYIEQSVQNREIIRKQAIILKEKGESLPTIATNLKIPKSTLDIWFYTNFINTGPSPECLSFVSWCEQYVQNNQIYDVVKSVRIFESNVDVYDVTMESIFDFVTNGVVTHDCMKDRAVAMTRVRLKDIDAKCWAFSEDEIDLQLEMSLSDFNAWPTYTCFSWDTLPENFLGVITLGAQVFSLMAQGLLEAGREFSITDNGISFVNPPISTYMQSTATTLLSSYTEMKEKIKSNMKPSPAGIGTFRVMSILPGLTRLRHLRQKQII